MQSLGASERVEGRAFCDPVHTRDDGAILARLRRSLAEAARGPRAAELRFADTAGVHHLVVPDWDALAERRPIAIVGFFGQARPEVDHAPIIALEEAIVARASELPGLIAYHNARLSDDRWGNLVAFASPADTAVLAGDDQHADAVASTPRHYASLRLHRGGLADGCLGPAGVAIRETLALDFAQVPPWRALRLY
jgi:hypothetical protein